ncbi:extracellular solute-binding protein [Neisseria elongata]
MKKTLLTAMIALALAACGGKSEQAADSQNNGQTPATAANSGATDALNIYNWSNYVDEDTVDEFKQANNLKLVYDLYENNETLEAKVLTGKSGYDLVVPGIAFLPRQIQAGAYQKINKDLIPNYKDINPKLLEMLATADPGNEYAVPYFSGVNTVAITAKGKEALGGQLPENGWDLLFKPEYTSKLKGCGIAMWDTPSEVLPIILNYLGKDPAGKNPADIEAAAEVLKKVRPDIKRFSPSLIDELARGDVCLAVGNGGDLNMAKKRSEEVGSKVGIEVLTPKGMGFWIESWLIPADAKNVANAHKYINYTLQPEIAARNGNFVTFAPASLPAKKLMDPKLVEVRSIFPNDQDMADGFVMPQMSNEAKKQTVDLWQKIKSGN